MEIFDLAMPVDKIEKTVIKPKTFYALVFTLLFLSIEATLGGIALIVQPSGRLIGLSTDLLYGSPFSNYLIPGLALFVLLGIFPAVVLYGLWYRPKYLFEEFLNGSKKKFAKKLKSAIIRFTKYINIDKSRHWAWSFTLYCGILLVAWINLQTLFMGYFTVMQIFYSFMGLFIICTTLLPSFKDFLKANR